MRTRYGPTIGWPRPQDDFVLYILIRYASMSLLRLFLGRAPVRTKPETNPLIYAVGVVVERARILLLHGAKLDLSGTFVPTNGNGCISALPIEAAVQEGDRKLVDLFLAEGSPVPNRLFSATLPVKGHFSIPARVIPRLLQTDEFVEWAMKLEDKTSLLRAMDLRNYSYRYFNPQEEGDVVGLVRRLRQIGLDLSGDNSFVEILLRQAAYAGHISTIKYLLLESEIPLPRDILLDASLCDHCNEAMICFLIRNKAGVHVVSPGGNTALRYALKYCLSEKSCLERTKVLCDAGCDPSACNLNDCAPIHIAAIRGYTSVFKYLLSIGAPLPPDILLRASSNRDTAFGQEYSDDLGILSPPGTSISISHFRSSAAIPIRFLLAEGADVGVVAANGDTVLHAFLRSIDSDDLHAILESIKMLVAAGCDLENPNSEGETSVVLAFRAGHVPVMKYLLSLHIPLPADILLAALRASRLEDKLPMIKFLLNNGANRHVTSSDGRNVLHHAINEVNHHCFQLFKTLVDAGCDLFACSSHGETLLHAAVRYGRLEVIHYLLSRGLPLPSDILLVASRFYSQNPQFVQFLIDKGADVRATAADGNTPLHLAVQVDSWPGSCALESVKILINAGSDPSALNSSHKTPMHAAVARGHIPIVSHLLLLRIPLPPNILLTASDSDLMTVAPLIRFLVEQGADTSIVTTEGDTALHLALSCQWGDQDDRLETTKILIGAGCDIHACNSAGVTPLLAAAMGGHIAIVEYLLAQGVPLPLSGFLAAASSTRHGSWKTAIIRFLATLDGPDIHFVASNGDTVLHRAVESSSWDERGCLEIVNILVGLGCDPSLQNSAGETPLHISVRSGLISVVKYLLSQATPLPPDVLLSAALENRNMARMMRLLIGEGADPRVANNNGDTPLHVVLKNHSLEPESRRWAIWGWEAIQILLEAGGDPYARNLEGQTSVDLAARKGSCYAENFMRLVKNAPNVRSHGLIRSSELTESPDKTLNFLRCTITQGTKDRRLRVP